MYRLVKIISIPTAEAAPFRAALAPFRAALAPRHI